MEPKNLQKTQYKLAEYGLYRSARFISLIGLIGCFAVAALANGYPGYLPCIGPASLRFQKPPLPFTNIFVLSAPEPAEPSPLPPPPPPVAVQPTTNAPVAAVVTSASSEPVTVVSSQIPAPQIPPPARPDEVVSPQMLMRFFSKGTNGTSTSVVAPIEFTPPKTETPPSKAEYIIGK